MSNAALSVEDLGKRYRIAGQRVAYGSLRETVVDAVQAPLRRIRTRGVQRPEFFWALQNVSFEVGWGEVLGIVGPNGAGKSTLLKILSRVTYPTAGRAEVNGRVCSLLEVGTGFHTELTGRENIFLNGAVLGMRRAEIRRKFDAIVDFAGLERFLDTPVKRYSTGMFMRLAFSVAAHLEPEILIVDEVLAVGDAAFQKKCLSKMGSVSREGRTILFVSHNMPAIQALCHRALRLQQGRVVDEGPPAAVVQRYLASQINSAHGALEQRRDRSGDGSARIVSIDIESAESDGIIRPGSRLRVRLGYRSDAPLRRPQFVVTIVDHLDAGLFLLHNEFTGGLPETLPPEGVVTCETDPINVTPGSCIVHVELLQGNVQADFVPHVSAFDVQEDDVFGTGMQPARDYVRYVLGQRWSLDADSLLGLDGQREDLRDQPAELEGRDRRRLEATDE
jgi:lipopolysaccharide transport system ATP-binding protein